MVAISTARPSRLLNSSLAVLLIASIFSSALLYNRAEGGIVLLAIFAAILSFNLSALRQDKKSQKILLLQLIFAASVLLTGYEIFGRTLVNPSRANELFGSLASFSLLGLFSYHFLKQTNGTRFVFPIFGVLCAILLVYSMTYDGRVFDLTGRYVITLGLPLCIFSLTFLGSLDYETKPQLYGVIFFNTVTLFVVALGIASRTHTLALFISWALAAFILKHPLRIKLAYFLIPILFSGVYLVANSEQFNNFVIKRFVALTEVVGETEPVTSDSSINTRLSLLKLGVEASRDNLLFGAGNDAEGKLIKEHVGNFAHFHNQFLSFIVQGGIFHLIAGLCYIIAPFIVLFRSAGPLQRRAIILPSLFLISLLPFSSYHNFGGMAHLHILFSWILAAIVTTEAPKQN